MQTVNLGDDLFQGHVSLEHLAAGVKPWRLPFVDLPLHHDGLVGRAETAAGVRLRFRSDAECVRLQVAATAGERTFDLTCDNELLHSHVLPAGGEVLAFDHLGGEERVYELWFDHRHPVVVTGLAVNPRAQLEAEEDTRSRWVTYGSSITHCGAAYSPARTWPATAARLADLHLTCLGYGGNCHLEALVGTMIRDLPADFISLKLGINVYGGSSLSRRTWLPAVTGLIRLIREKHPDTPIAVITSIAAPTRENEPNAVGFTLAEMREVLAEAVGRLQTHGDEHLHLFSGLDLLGIEETNLLLPDMVHPSAEGYETMGRRMVEHVLSDLRRKYEF